VGREEPMTKKHNYKNKIKELVKEDKISTTPGVYILHIYHDEWCSFLKGGECNCNPDLIVQPIDQKGQDPQ
jgi:Fe-S-cluster containining protein